VTTIDSQSVPFGTAPLVGFMIRLKSVFWILLFESGRRPVWQGCGFIRV